MKMLDILVNEKPVYCSKELLVAMFSENRVEMLWLSPRISYIRGDGKPENRAPFQSGYLCSGICDRQLAFEYLLEKI